MNDFSPFKEYLLGKKKNDVKCVWWLNIGVEEAWSTAEGFVIPRLSGGSSGSVVNRSEQMCLMMADSNDIVIMRDEVSSIVKESLTLADFDLPEIWRLPQNNVTGSMPVSQLIYNNHDITDKLKYLKRTYDDVLLIPYAVTLLEKEIEQATGCRIVGSLPELVEWTNNKVNARLLAIEAGLPVTQGFICRSIDEILSGMNQLRESGISRTVLKDAYGASGKGLYIVDSEKSMDLLNQKLLRKRGTIKHINAIIEKWYDTTADINYQIFIRDDGTVVFIPPKKQILSGVIYKGSEFPVDCILNEKQIEIYIKSADIIGKKLYERGYRGIASIDSIISKDGNVFPVVEINGRFSLSTYISFMPVLLDRARFFLSKYYNVYFDTIMPEVLDYLRQNNYTTKKGEGLIVYSYAEKNGTIPGRAFILYAYRDLYELCEKEKYVTDLFSGINQ